MDKMIHADEFRLRVLLTNQCDKNCDFCLNDFQPKKPKQYAFAFDLVDCIRAYGQFMKSIKEIPIVTFSGGEPGLHPNLNYILSHAKYYCHTVKVVTNGLAFYESYLPYVDKWHIGVTGKNQNVLEIKKITDKVSVQIVVTDSMDKKELLDLVRFYKENDISVKLFVDFYSDNREKLEDLIEDCCFHGIETRFTGKQINRGKACFGCEKDCVTLKALWFFPDGSSSTCPQGMVKPFDDDSWDETVEKAYEAHKI